MPRSRLPTSPCAQVSLVCRAFGRAAAGVELQLWLRGPNASLPFERAPACLSSRLLCSWAATSLQHVVADLDLCLDSGLLNLVEAAPNLHSLTLSGSSPAACELACRLIAAAPSLQTLRCSGAIVPGGLPVDLKTLTVAKAYGGFGSQADVNNLLQQVKPGTDVVEIMSQYRLQVLHLQAELGDLLLQLPKLAALSRLKLSLGTSYGLPSLAAIPETVGLSVSLLVTDHCPVQLGWLLRCNCELLEVTIETEQPCQHQATVELLQQLPAVCTPDGSPVSDFVRQNTRRVELAVPFSLPLQRIWSQCTATINLTIQASSPALQMLPQAATVVLQIKGVQDIAWSAMLGRNMVICLGPSAQLRGHGCPHFIADSCDGPTELCITGRGLSQVQGFPAATLPPDSFGEVYHIRTRAVPILEV